MSNQLSDYEIGKLRFRMCQPFASCQNKEQQRGWSDAENSLAWRLWIETSPQQRDYVKEIVYA